MKHYDDGDWQDPYSDGVSDPPNRCAICGKETEDIYCSRACEAEDLRLAALIRQNGRRPLERRAER